MYPRLYFSFDVHTVAPFLTVILLTQINDVVTKKNSPKKNMEEEAVRSRCSGCQTFVENFMKGLAKTANSKFGVQEQQNFEPRFRNEKLGSYAASETRLVEIMEGACGKDYYCNWVAAEFEDDIESWYYHKQNLYPVFAQFLCNDKAKLCCADDHFGPDCKPCSSLKCGLHGKCQGRGTRTGAGQCDCDAGYVGGRCQKCAPNYFGTNDSCSACDAACEGCTASGASNCVECAKGHIRTILSGNTCINMHKDLPSPTRLQIYLIGIHVVCLLLLTYASYIYKGGGFCKMVFVVLLALMVAYHKIFYSKSMGADGYPEQFGDPVVSGSSTSP